MEFGGELARLDGETTAIVRARAGAVGEGVLTYTGRAWRCALGRAGCSAAKLEGDGATPIGSWRIREVWVRSDRGVVLPQLPWRVREIAREDGWCDAPDDPAYNLPVKHPYPSSAEHLWREDGLYDVIVVLGYNDAPVVPGLGSAIFMHVARSDYAPTEGCVALARDDLLALLGCATPPSAVRIEPGG